MGRRKLFETKIYDCLQERIDEKDGITWHFFSNLETELIPQLTDINKFVYNADDVNRKKFVLYRISNCKHNEKFNRLEFTVLDLYRGSTRIFLQDTLVLVPDDVIRKKHRKDIA